MACNIYEGINVFNIMKNLTDYNVVQAWIVSKDGNFLDKSIQTIRLTSPYQRSVTINFHAITLWIMRFAFSADKWRLRNHRQLTVRIVHKNGEESRNERKTHLFTLRTGCVCRCFFFFFDYYY